MYINSSDSEITVDYHKSYGAQVEYDRHWDNFQRNGTRTVYTYAYYTAGWTNENFKPKYDIEPTNASYMFAESSIYGDLVKILEELGVKLDFSKATNVGAVFSTTKFTRIGVVDLSSVTTANYALRVFLYNYYLKTIDKVITNPNVMYTYWFNGCNELEEVRFEGEIADSVDIHWSKKLSAQSFVSIVEHLSSTTSGKTLTVSSTAVANADWSTTNYASWDELIATKTNWSFVKSN
jgi:hypothetical protein